MVSSTKTSNGRPTPSSLHTIVFFFYVFDAIDAIVKKLRDCTHAQNHGKAGQAHMKRMAWNEDAFTQKKSVPTRFFFSVLGPLAPMAPKPEKKCVRTHAMQTWYRKFTL